MHNVMSTDEQTVTKESREDIAYRRYRRKSGEEKLLEHKLKKRRYAASLDYFLKKDDRESHKHHNQYLLKMHHRLAQNQVHCNNYGCENKCLPFSNKCSRRILLYMYVPEYHIRGRDIPLTPLLPPPLPWD